MNSATPQMQSLARKLIALEANSSPANPRGDVASACDKLRIPLSKLAGVAGFRSLLARALTLATAESPWLSEVKVADDGTLQGFDEARQRQPAEIGVAGGILVVAQLLGLLVTFIGEPLTRRLVGDAWPDARMDESASTGRERP